MKTINLTQGTTEWLDWRKTVFTASDAPAMMDVSKYKSRKELIKEKATGISKPITPELQAIFDEGHTTEDLARPIIENEIGQTLYNVVAVSDTHPHIAASFDGITMDDSTIFEHKVYRDSKASRQRYDLAKDGKLLDMDMIQVQQQLLVSNADKCLFVVSDGTRENMATVTVLPNKELQTEIIDGWEKFKKDVENYTDAVSADEDLTSLYREYSKAKAIADEANANVKNIETEIKKRAKTITDKTGAIEIIGQGFGIHLMTRKGNVDYSKIEVLKDIDLEQYRKPSTQYYRIATG
ncbi:MAG: YqaJ viral recombinase family protein [Gammaproteobacteria bacterium]|nr:YqaJ viral recombinase family protein [Gammaproteobacteria bacterium]